MGLRLKINDSWINFLSRSDLIIISTHMLLRVKGRKLHPWIYIGMNFCFVCDSAFLYMSELTMQTAFHEILDPDSTSALQLSL